MDTLPREVQDIIFFDVAADEWEDGCDPKFAGVNHSFAISSGKLKALDGYYDATLGFNFSVSSRSAFLASTVTRASYLRAVQIYAVCTAQNVPANVSDYNFANLWKYLSAVKAADALTKFDDTLYANDPAAGKEERRMIIVTQHLTANLDREPPTLDTWCRMTDRLWKEGHRVNIEYTIARVASEAALRKFFERYSVTQLVLRSPHQIHRIIFAAKLYLLSTAVVPRARS